MLRIRRLIHVMCHPMNEREFENWVMQQREQVIQYLQAQNVIHNGVGNWPAFEIAPHFAIWAIQSKITNGKVGWWAFSGDIPTDYISGLNISDPRQALGHLLKTWQEYLPNLKQGLNPLGVQIGNENNKKELGDLLERRILFLTRFYEDNELWAEILDSNT